MDTPMDNPNCSPAPARTVGRWISVAIGLLLPLGSALAASWESDRQMTSSYGWPGYWSLTTSGNTVHMVRGDGAVYYRRSVNEGDSFEAERFVCPGTPYLEQPIVAQGDDVYVLGTANMRTVYDWWGARPVGDLFLAVSHDGGVSWKQPMQLTTAQGNLRQSIAVSGSAVHVVWMDFRSGRWDLYYRRSTNRGETWLPETLLSAGQEAFGAERPTIAAEGDVVNVLWMDARDLNSTQTLLGMGGLTNSTEIYGKRSLDGGASWGADTRLTFGSYSGRPVVTSIGPGQLVACYDHALTFNDTFGLEQFALRSTNGGMSWSSPIRISNAFGNSTHGDLASAGGIVYCAWFDDRDGNNEIYVNTSSTGGLSWGTEQRMTNAPGTSETPVISATANYLHAVWYDTRTGGDIWYSRMPLGSTPVNAAPTVSAGPDLAAILPGTASLNGTAGDDGLPNPPSTLTTTWAKVSGPGTVTFTNASARVTTVGFSIAGTYLLRLTASDSMLSASDDVTVTVRSNLAPTVSAGPDLAVTLPSAATLSGSSSDDGLPNGTLATTWSTVSGPGTVIFAAPNATTTTASFSAAGAYVLRLTAGDGALVASDDAVVTVGSAPPPPPSNETVWVEDSVPAGAVIVGSGGDAWSWIASNPTPFSGSLAHKSDNGITGVRHQHVFSNASATLTVGSDDRLFAYVYLDPANPPSEVMLQWNDGSWEHRAYWGANNQITVWGVDGTDSRRSMGALPPLGRWVRLEVPSSSVGLAGHVLNGMAFTLVGGRASWDRAGASRPSNPTDPSAIAEWRFDEGAGSVAGDSSGHNHPGTISSATWTTGTFGTALAFNRSGTVSATVSEIPTATGTRATVEFWMRWDGGGGVMPVGFSGIGGYYDLWLSGDSFGFNTGNSDLFGIASAGLASRWVHVVAEFHNGDAKLSKLYVDGIAQNLTQRIGFTGFSRLSPTLRISGWPYDAGYRFGGVIDGVRIYDRALTPSEVSARFTAVAASPPVGNG
jgi:hypothetical protein